MPLALRQTLALICLVLGLTPDAHAVGLGEADLRSHLGSPLDLSIPIHHLGDLRGEDIRIAISALNDEVSGHPLDSMVSSKFQLSFDNENGTVRLRSDAIIMEPYLAFTLSVRWPRGYLKREYTVLIDYPAVRDRDQLEIVATVGDGHTATSPSQQTAEAGTTEAPAMAEPSRQPESRQRSARQSEPDSLDDGRYRVARGDSLWKLAQRLSTARKGAHNQWMAALYEHNPRAFIRGRPDLLKEAYLLTVPEQCSKLKLVLAPNGRSFELVHGDRSTKPRQLAEADKKPDTVPAPPDERAPPTSEPEKPIVAERIDANAPAESPPYENAYGLNDREDVAGPYADNPTLDLSTSSTATPPATSPHITSQKEVTERIQTLEQELAQARKAIEERSLQQRLDAAESGARAEPAVMRSDMAGPVYLFQTAGWMAMGMALVLSVYLIRSRGFGENAPKVITRDRRRRDFAAMLERNRL